MLQWLFLWNGDEYKQDFTSLNSNKLYGNCTYYWKWILSMQSITCSVYAEIWKTLQGEPISSDRVEHNYWMGGDQGTAKPMVIKSDKLLGKYIDLKKHLI